MKTGVVFNLSIDDYLLVRRAMERQFGSTVNDGIATKVILFAAQKRMSVADCIHMTLAHERQIIACETA